jgi:hypothetical protein
LADALTLVEKAAAAIWMSEGSKALACLHDRGLTDETIKAARLGWTPKVSIPIRDGAGYWRVSGITIPWIDGDRLALVKIRRLDGRDPKYAEAYRDRPLLFPTPEAVRPGPLIIVEGELDALLLGQAIGERAAVVTLGSASAHPEVSTYLVMLPAFPWYLAQDADGAGDRAAVGWPQRSIRVRPPAPYKDWTEAAQAGVNLARWWNDRLAGIENPALATWAELAAEPYAVEERAAIMEFQGGLTRQAADVWAELAAREGITPSANGLSAPISAVSSANAVQDGESATLAREVFEI